MDRFSRLNLNKINPMFLTLCRELIDNCSALGYDYFAISGFRSPEEQAKLYAQGRTTEGKIVTNAPPFSSLHQFGMAIDFCLDGDKNKDGLQPLWQIDQYETLAQEARKLGLITGMDFKKFKEGPHIQMATTKQLQELKKFYQEGGLENVWKNL